MFQKLSNILLILLISLKLFPSRFLFSQSSENYLNNYIFFKILYNNFPSYLNITILENSREEKKKSIICEKSAKEDLNNYSFRRWDKE